MFPFGEPVTIRARSTAAEDAHGNPTVTWSAGVTVQRCGFDPGSSVESRQPGREPVVSSPRVFLPAGTVVGARDLVVVRGRTYTVQGDPAVWRSPLTGWEPGVVAELEVVDG